MTHQEIVEEIKNVLMTLKPAIAAHGGSIDFVSLHENIVSVRLSGACINCPISFLTLKLGIEQAIKEKIPGIQEVVAVN